MEKKKYLIVLVLRLLELFSSEKNPLTQKWIADTISSKYPCDRKSVGRNIIALRELGFPIVKTSKGFYLTREDFSCDELDLVRDSIQGMESTLSAEEKRYLWSRVHTALARYYRIK